jgi:hypothetical protein
MVTDQEMKRLSKDAHALRQQHLLDLITDAERRDDTQCAKAIQEMLEQEAQKKQWHRINYSTRLPCGGNPTLIQVQTSTGTTK